MLRCPSMKAPNLSAIRDSVRAVEWLEGRLKLLDQRRLPGQCEYLFLDTTEEVAEAIRDMAVRGAPAIGIAAAYGVVLAARAAFAKYGSNWREGIHHDLQRLLHARPTAFNLRWAVDRMKTVFARCPQAPEPTLLAEAKTIHAEDIAANRRMGEIGAGFIKPASRVLTHCNAGALATGGFGTALGVVRTAHTQRLIDKVYADETRPWLQGARLTAWELIQDGIPVTLLADSAAAYLMQRGGIDWVIVGADRIAANGDAANKIGTYGLALAARAHGVGFMVVAPTSTVDLTTPSGGVIRIEERGDEELLRLGNQPTAASGATAWNPVFDITPANLIDVIVTERGAIERPDQEKLAGLWK